MEDKLGKYQDIAKRVVMPRFRCPCNCRQSKHFDTLGDSTPTKTESDETSPISTPQKDDVDLNLQDSEDEDSGIFTTIKLVEVKDGEENVTSKVNGDVSSLSKDNSEQSDKVSTKLEIKTAENQYDVRYITEEYHRTCISSISFKDINDVMKYFKSSKSKIPDNDMKCLVFCNAVITAVTKRGGEKIWQDATLAVYGKAITVILQSGVHETNHFEVAPDHEDKPIQNCPKRGLRLQFWDGVPMVVSASKTILPIIMKMIPPKLVSDQIGNLVAKWFPSPK